MRKIIILFALIITGFSGYTQVIVDDINVNDLDIQYVELRARQKFLSTKVIVNVDYGQKFRLFVEQSIRSKDGKKLPFNSVIHALNFMDQNGWEYVSNIIYADKDGNTLYHYLLQRKKE